MPKNILQKIIGPGVVALLFTVVVAFAGWPLVQAQSTPTFNQTITPTDTGIAPPNSSGTQTAPSVPNSSGTQTAPSVPNSSGTITQPVGTGGSNTGTFGLQNPLDKKFNSVGSLLSGFLDIFSYLVVLLAVLLIIWVGLQFVLARGNPDRIKELKGWLLWIVIGVAIVIGARIIVSAVINTLSATGTVNQSVINQANNALGN